MRLRPLLLVLAILGSVAPARAASPAARARIDPALLDARGTVLVAARFERAVPDLTGVAGLDVTYRFGALPGIVARATPDAVRRLATAPGLVSLEGDARIAFDLDTATKASRAKEVWDGDDPLEVGGEVVDGSGIGIAIVDTGVDGTHPDLAEHLAGNYQLTPAGPVPVGPYTSHPQSAHGTHVAGIAVGTGALSGGRYRGAAPGSSLYGFNMYDGSLIFAAIAFDWIHQNGASLSPPIRVVNNSWHCIPSSCSHPLNGSMHMALASRLAEDGFVVTWAVGNEPGDGTYATTNPEPTNRTPGIVGVANYKEDASSYTDAQRGSRAMCLSSTSAWGASDDPTTWPDVAAPGRSITSTWAAGPYDTSLGVDVGRNPVTGDDAYWELSGTSMAAPHVAGIAALMLQANPALSPAEVEYLLKQTSTPLTGPPSEDPSCGIGTVRADPDHPWHGANYAAGHGLVDAHAAVEAAVAFTAIPEPIPTEPIPADFLVPFPGISEDRTLYLQGEDGLGTSYPDADRPVVRAYDADDVVTHTSAPFDASFTFDAVNVELYLGTTAEANDLGGSRIGDAWWLTEVWRIPASGPAERVADGIIKNNFARRTLTPNHRRYRTFLDDPVTLEPGDRIRLDVYAFVNPYQGVEPALNGFWDLYTESWTPSRVVLGGTIDRPAPGSRADCDRRLDCAMVDARHPYEGLWCDEEIPVRLRWTGPAGSALVYQCDGVAYACEILGEPGSTGTCERDIAVTAPTRDISAFCTYRLPNGSRGGEGSCRALWPVPRS